MLRDDRVLTSFSRLTSLSKVVTKMSSWGLQARMLSKEGRNSSKQLWMVGMTTVTSSAVYDGFSGMGFDLYVQWLKQWTMSRT